MVLFAHICGCTKRDGEAKRRYSTRSDAESTRLYILSQRGVRLRVYECPEGPGYHLTSNLNGSY